MTARFLGPGMAAALALAVLFASLGAPAALAESPPPAPYDWYRYQGAPESGPSASVNCEVTSIAMSIQYAREGLRVPISTVRQFIGRDGPTATGDAERSLKNWGVPYRGLNSVPEIMDALGRGHIVMVGLMMDRISLGADYQRGYSSPEYRFGRYYPFDGAHSIIVKDVTPDKGWFVVYDPNVWDSPAYWYSDRTPKGKDRYYPVGEVARGMEALGDWPKGLEILSAPPRSLVSSVQQSAPVVRQTAAVPQQTVVKSGAQAPAVPVREPVAQPTPPPAPPPVLYLKQSADLRVLGSLGRLWKSVTFALRIHNPRGEPLPVAQLGVQGRDPGGREFFAAHGQISLQAGGEASLAIPMATAEKGSWTVHRVLYFAEGQWRELAASGFLQKVSFHIE